MTRPIYFTSAGWNSTFEFLNWEQDGEKETLLAEIERLNEDLKAAEKYISDLQKRLMGAS